MKSIKKINIFIAIFSVLIIGGSIFAITNKYKPGETLNPSCNPGETNCTVNLDNKTIDISWKYWTWNSVDGSHSWYGKGNNFRNCVVVHYFQNGETIQNTKVYDILKNVLGWDRTLWDDKPQHEKFLRDFNVPSAYPINHIHYGSWATTKYGPSTLYKCQVDSGTGETIIRIF